MDKKMDMRRRDRQLSEEETREVLQQGEYGVLSTVCPDGTPYGVPLNFALEDGRIYLHCANAEGQKIVNLQHCPDACFTVVSSTKLLPEKFSTLYRSAIVCGRVSTVEDDEEKRQGLEAILRKYSPEFIESGLKYIEAAFKAVRVLRLDVASISGKGRKQ